MDFQALRTLMETHPQWPSVTDADLLVWLNALDGVTRDKTTLSTGEVFGVILNNRSEWLALSEAERQAVRDIISAYGDGIPVAAGAPARAVLVSIFGGTTTVSQLAALIPEDVSRAANAGVGFVKTGNITFSRNI